MIKFIKGFIIGLLLMVLPIIIKTLIILEEPKKLELPPVDPNLIRYGWHL